MKTKVIFFLLFASTLLCITNVKALTLSEATKDMILNSSQSRDLNEKILRIENSLFAQSEEESPNSKFNLAERMVFYKTPGVSIAVIDKGKIDWARGYGVREVDRDEPIDTDTLFQAASISKPVTASGVLKLVQSGKLNLDDDVNQKLISWKVPNSRFTEGKKVTLRNLLSHSASLTVHGFDGYGIDEEVPTLLEVLNGEKPANSDEIKVDDELDREFKYSGGGYVVIQQLLSDVTGKPFSTFMQETVLNKLGMKNSTYQQPLSESKIASAAAGHNEGKTIEGGWRTYPEMAAAGLWTTPSDLARFAIAIQQSVQQKEGGFLNQDIVEQMFTSQVGGWGLGFELPKGKSVRFVHSGANEGFQCLLVAYKNTGQGAVIMTNSDRGLYLAIEIMNSISKEYSWSDKLSSPLN